MTTDKAFYFNDQAEFRKWLEAHHKASSELLVGFYKVNTGRPSMTWPQSVDQALCFGWIDGVRKTIDKDSYCIRFTPRKPTSIWSAVNIDKIKKLTDQGLMQPAGIDAFQKRSEERSKVYSFENDAKLLSAHLEAIFKADSPAWDFFVTQAPSYQKSIIHWIMAAKQEVTQLARLEKTISESHLQRRLK